MQRLIEQPSDEGDIFEGSRPLGRVHYRLSVYQQFSEADAEPVDDPRWRLKATCRRSGRLDVAELHVRRRRADAPPGRRAYPRLHDGERRRHHPLNRARTLSAVTAAAMPDDKPLKKSALELAMARLQKAATRTRGSSGSR